MFVLKRRIVDQMCNVGVEKIKFQIKEAKENLS